MIRLLPMVLAFMPSVALAATYNLLPPKVTETIRLLGLPEEVQIVRLDVPDEEPLYMAYRDNGHHVAFRAGEEQCMDKLLTPVPCAVIPQPIQAPPFDPSKVLLAKPPSNSPVPQRPSCCVRVPDPPVVPLAASFLFLLTSLMSLYAVSRFQNQKTLKAR